MTQLIPAWIDGELHPVEKLSVHQQGLKHKAVSVFVLHQDRLLIQRRALHKYHTPGLWANTCCTHPEWGEPAQDCALRRLQQELGITGLTMQYRDTVEYRADVGGDMIEHEVADIFLAHAQTTPAIAPNPEEVMEIDWMTLPDLNAKIAQMPQIFTPWLKIYMAKHADQIFDQVGWSRKNTGRAGSSVKLGVKA